MALVLGDRGHALESSRPVSWAPSCSLPPPGPSSSGGRGRSASPSPIPERTSGLAGQEAWSRRAVIDELNAKGGIRGRPIELVPFDDASSAETARANVQAIADSPCVAVLGHYLSTTSSAAGPGYKSARIPALTGTSSCDDLTRGNEFYFRAQTTSSLQGALDCRISAGCAEGAQGSSRPYARSVRVELPPGLCQGL